MKSKAQSIAEQELQYATFHDLKLVEEIKYCSDYDEECKYVPDPAKCFMGIMPCPETNENFGIADGLCKMMEKNDHT